MIQTTNEQFYFHINSNANMSPHPIMRCGDIFEIGGTSNPFFHFYEAYQRSYPVTDTSTGTIQQIPAMKFLRLVKDGTVTATELPTIARDTANHFLMLARELLWENVRLAEFPDAPSRQNCIWLIESMADVTNWISQLGFEQSHYSVVRVRATGKSLKVDSNFLAGDSEPLPVWLEKAHEYWSGMVTQTPLPEVLFVGHIEVDEIIDMDAFR